MHFSNIVVLLCGLLSGISLLITGNTMNFWLAKSGFSKESLGLFALVALPYSVNFLWAPIFDKFKAPLLGNFIGLRAGWVLFLSSIMSFLTFVLSTIDPLNNTNTFVVVSILISFFATSKDVVLGAIRSDILTNKQQATTSGVYVLGYRIGMMIASSGAIFVSSYFSWSFIYKLLGLLTFLITIVLCFYVERCSYQSSHIKSHGEPNLVQGLKALSYIKNIIVILVFLILYRLPDNFISIMLNAFMLDLNFSEAEIALYSKTLGTIGSIVGSLVAGMLMYRMNIVYALSYFGTIHILAHLMLVIQSLYGRSIVLMSISVTVESITGGMCMSAYIAFITSMCRGKYKATQYSLFTAMMGLSRSLFPSVSGLLVGKFGWTYFFIICIFISLPSFLIMPYIKSDSRSD